ncbi:carboxypeptidase-like regulatory domain-containing protein [Zhouia sp. PK063]|uniref:carboxypeptidase-like regulatory domain-containing protein n=1 Tax=Zhouia sp. PK063 TaxID=3373602 RepID=UPI0037949FF1
MYKLVFLMLCVGCCAQGQTLNGVVYTANSRAANITVTNLNTQKSTHTDAEGAFTLTAQVHDTLLFTSVFYQKLKFTVTPNSLSQPQSFHLMEQLNQLEEVTVDQTVTPKAFNKDAYTNSLQASILEDIKNHPELYNRPAGTAPDLILIVGKIISLFHKRKPAEKEVTYITAKQLDSLFTHTELFNVSLLKNPLHITTDRKYIFYYYCEKQYLNTELLQPEKQFLLLDKLVNYSKQFHELSKTSTP